MDTYKIRMSHTDSVNSVDKENFLDVQLESTSKKLHFNDIKTTIDQYELFKKERSECLKYRMILTINPYCTNVLFNPLTEVCKKGADGSVERYFLNTRTVNGLDGQQTPQRVQMIANTEYSKESPRERSDSNYGYTYMPGYDIFDNHIFRNDGYKIVEVKNTSSRKNVFNTLGDYDRSPDGKILTFHKRKNLTSKPTKENKHLYGYDDLMSFEGSVNANLTDENGWFGFINPSNLITTSVDGKERSDICRVINNRKNCEFIDMYPDRTLFSFSPKYNKEQDRLENNWDVFVTYAYGKEYCNDLVSFKSLNSLPVMYVTKTTGVGNNEIYVFRCYTKHNLKRNDLVKVYDCSENDDADEPVGVYRVSNIGDGASGDPDYYFYIDGFDADGINTEHSIRIRKTYNGMDSEYYIRKLKKIKKVNGNDERDLTVERYKLAFATTIYDDDTTQFTFTDDIDISELRDNLNRPLTELFITVIKRNAGHEVWYSTRNESEADIDDEDVEMSHCFDDVMVGFLLSHEKSDRLKTVENLMQKREAMRDVRVINKWNYYGSLKYPITVTEDGTTRFVYDDGDVVTETENDVFYGDVVEYSADECSEFVLSDCAYRFNTYQRETPMVEKFIYHEIAYDDYDLVQHSSDDNIVEQKQVNNVVRREGYYYKANYSIPIRGLSEIRQMGNKDIRVANVKPIYKGNVVLRITSSLPSRLNTNDIVYVCDDKNRYMFEFVCVEVKSPTTFSIEPRIPDSDDLTEDKWEYFGLKCESVYGNGYAINWLQLSDLLTNGELKLRGKNYDIPDYAFKAGNNAYIWRDVVYGEQDSTIPDYTFANGAFYLTPIIRFYLKRQDPDNSIGLYEKESFPNDVYGNIQKRSDYYYVEDLEDQC